MARLTREDWLVAAYEAFQHDGLSAVRVEPVAKRLDATKGSFYWHFADRRALLEAVLARWETLETDAIVDAVELLTDPIDRVHALLRIIAHRTGERTGERTLYADAQTLGVVDIVTRVTERRVSYTARLLASTGMDASEARSRAVIIVSAVVGYQQLTIDAWGAGVNPIRLVDTLERIALGP